MDKYITLSLELHLFFGRIMKEHSFFLEAGFPSKNKNLIDEAEWYKNQFEKLLLDVVRISKGVVTPELLNSNEIVTEYTLTAEKISEDLSGIALNKEITELERKLVQTSFSDVNRLVSSYDIQMINNRALNLVNGLINFKERLLNEIFKCELFTFNYPLLIDHILREAKLYRSYIMELEEKHDITSDSLKNLELFWNRIMMEHALFIRGLLDPSEEELIKTADNFAKEYKELLEKSRYMNDEVFERATNKSLQETLKYKEFKVAGTKGLIDCKIKSIIIPLLADHVLREANHYLRILREKV